MESKMSDPQYTDPLNDPRRPRPRDPAELRGLDVQDDAGRGAMWAWIVGIIAVIVVAMLVYDYNLPSSTTASTPPTSSSSTTTGAAPPSPAKVSPPALIPVPANPAPATPSPADTPR
jgi:hypothetical protein